MCFRESPTRKDTNWPAQLQRPARILKFRIYKLEVSFCPGSDNKGADQTARLRLCCSHIAKTGFLMARLIQNRTIPECLRPQFGFIFRFTNPPTLMLPKLKKKKKSDSWKFYFYNYFLLLDFKIFWNIMHSEIWRKLCFRYGPRQANLVLIAYASSEGSGEPAHPRSLARTFAARSYKQWVKRNLQTESQIPGPSEWLGMRSWNLSWRNARRHKFAWRGSYKDWIFMSSFK